MARPGVWWTLRHPLRAWRRSTGHRVMRQGGELELLHRAMGFAALGMVTLVPLLIVVAAAVPFQQAGFAQWIVDGMGLSPTPSEAVRKLFAAPRRVLSSTSVLSLVLLGLFGLSFAAAVEVGYLRIWELPPAPWHQLWRRAVWLVALTAYLFAEAQSGTVLREGLPAAFVRVALTLVLGVLFFWWAQHFLLAGRISWGALLPGAILTVAGLVGLRIFSSLVFSPLIVTNAVSYGAVGTVLIVQSWLIGVGYVVFGACLLGRHLSVPIDRFSHHSGGQAHDENEAAEGSEGDPHGRREEGQAHRSEDQGPGRGDGGQGHRQ
ncbi:ribonuclease BN [Streptomyces sp. NPDC088733]|uniref:ribonuclease BN n=1 Tax=Streptomyces sp. NPDC088733 TaxID=3365880 RepID=UPI0037F358A0